MSILRRWPSIATRHAARAEASTRWSSKSLILIRFVGNCGIKYRLFEPVNLEPAYYFLSWLPSYGQTRQVHTRNLCHFKHLPAERALPALTVRSLRPSRLARATRAAARFGFWQQTCTDAGLNRAFGRCLPRAPSLGHARSGVLSCNDPAQRLRVIRLPSTLDS